MNSMGMGDVLPAGDPRLPGGTWSSMWGDGAASPAYGAAAYGMPSASAASGAKPFNGAGGYTYIRLQSNAIAIIRGAAPSGTVPTFVAGYGVLPAVQVGTNAWSNINAEMNGTARPVAPAVQEAVNEDAAAAAGGLFSSIFASLGQGDPSKGQAVVAQVGAQYGPAVVNAIGQAMQNRGMSVPRLQQKIAAKMADYARAKASGNTAKATGLAYEIKALQAQVAAAQNAGLASVPDYPAAPPASSFPATGMSWWLPVAVIGGLVVVGGALALTVGRSRGGASAPAAVAVHTNPRRRNRRSKR